MRLTKAQRSNISRRGATALFSSARAEPGDMMRAMRWAWDNAGQAIDPQTAIGLHAALAQDLPGDVAVVTLATAHPAKFPDPVERATGLRPSLPARIGDLYARKEACTELPGDYAAVRDFILQNATSAG